MINNGKPVYNSLINNMWDVLVVNNYDSAHNIILILISSITNSDFWFEIVSEKIYKTLSPPLTLTKLLHTFRLQDTKRVMEFVFVIGPTAIYPASHMVGAQIFLIEIASGHLMYRSIIIRTYRYSHVLMT